MANNLATKKGRKILPFLVYVDLDQLFTDMDNQRFSQNHHRKNAH